MLHQVGNILILVGGLTAVPGVLLLYPGKIPWVGKLPGDIVVKRENFSLHFSIATSVIVSVTLTSLLNFFGHFFHR